MRCRRTFSLTDEKRKSSHTKWHLGFTIICNHVGVQFWLGTAPDKGMTLVVAGLGVEKSRKRTLVLRTCKFSNLGWNRGFKCLVPFKVLKVSLLQEP